MRILVKSLPLRDAYLFLEQNNLKLEAEEIRASKDTYLKYDSTLRRAKIVVLLKEKGIFEKFVDEVWPDGITKTNFYVNLYKRFVNELSKQIEEEENEEDITMGDESNLQNFLLKNIHVIEPDLIVLEKEYALNMPNGKNRFIDILAEDKNKNLVIIELKVNRGHERVIGQVLLYRNLLKRTHSDKYIRVIIVARNISNELKIATEGHDFIELYNYDMTFVVNRIND